MDESLHILVVEDDAVDRMAIVRALRTAGIEATVEEAETAHLVLELLEQRSYDIVLLDYWLPGSDGLATINEIRSRGFVVPVIVLTGQGDERLAVELIRNGASDYISKQTLSAEVLAQSIRNSLRLARAEEQTRQAEVALRASVERFHFLADASTLLASSLEVDVVLRRLAHLVVQYMADWCFIDMVGPDRSLQRLEAVTRHEDQQYLAETCRVTMDIDSGNDDIYISPRVVRTNEPGIWHTTPDKLARAPEHLRTVAQEMNISSVMCVPLAARDRVFGAITFVVGAGRTYEPADLTLAHELATRASVSLDNARLYNEACEAVQIRDVFLSIASHELKTPLTSLIGNAQLLERRLTRENTLSERDARSLRVIISQGSRLNKMISALLDITSLQTGQLRIDQTPVDVGRLVQRLVDEVSTTLDRHMFSVVLPEGPMIVNGDDIRLEQVLHNLIQNAVKYSPYGGTITVSLEDLGEQVAIRVADTGIGIPAEAIPQLFSRFFRAPNVSNHNIKGIGLGLYVVHEIVTLHGGTVDVQSVEGEGSTFTIILPLMYTTADIQAV